MPLRSPRARLRYAIHVAAVFGRALLILAVIAIAARLAGDGASLARQAAGVSILTVEAR